MNKLLEHHRRMSLKVDYKGNGERKPLYSYAALICLAMRDAGKKMTLSQIYRWIRDNFAYYRTGDKSWQVRRGWGGSSRTESERASSRARRSPKMGLTLSIPAVQHDRVGLVV